MHGLNYDTNQITASDAPENALFKIQFPPKPRNRDEPSEKLTLPLKLQIILRIPNPFAIVQSQIWNHCGTITNLNHR